MSGTRQKALSAARYWALQKAPYFASALLSMVPREVPLGTLSERGTFAMNDEGIFIYEPEAFDHWSTQEAGSVMIHEVMHWLRKHCARFIAVGGQHREHWQFAIDFEINDDLQSMRLPLPDGGGLHPRDEGMAEGQLAEAYYHELLRKHPPQAPPPSAKGGKCKCGGGSATGIRLPCEPEDDPGARPEAEVELMRVQVANAVKEHAQKNGMGSVPLGLRRWADDLTKPPKVPWGQKLARVAKSRVGFRPGAISTTYTKMNRRQGGLGFGVGAPVMSASIAHKAEIVMAIDTSGSMGKSDVERAIVESIAVLKAIGQSARLMACDAAVHSNAIVSKPADIIAAIKGGGGTDFRPVFDALAKAKPRPELVIFFTDGGGYAPPKAPKGVHTIWVLIGAHRCRPINPNGGSITYGDFIEVDD